MDNKNSKAIEPGVGVRGQVMRLKPDEEVDELMGRLRRGTRGQGPEVCYRANDLHAECYGVVGRLRHERNRLAEAAREVLAEIEYWHADMLSEEERAHPRGSGWARVCDKLKDALGA